MSCDLPMSLGQLLRAFQDTGCHSESRPGQLAFGDLPGAWGRGMVPECLEYDMWSGISPDTVDPQAGRRFGFIWASVEPLEYSRMLVLAGNQKSVSPTCSYFNKENRPRDWARESCRVS